MTERLRASGGIFWHTRASETGSRRLPVYDPTDRPNYSLHAQQSIHFPQQEPAFAVHPQLQEQHDLPQQQVELCVVSDMSDIA